VYEIEEIMHTDVISVRKDSSIDEVISLLVENNVTGLPVVSDDMTLIGIISEKDIMKCLSNSEGYKGKVEDLMTTEVVSFDVKSDLIGVCECLTKNHFRRVPILEEGKLVGIISRRDLIKYILEPIS